MLFRSEMPAERTFKKGKWILEVIFKDWVERSLSLLMGGRFWQCGWHVQKLNISTEVGSQ